MDNQEIIDWVHRFRPFMNESECLEAYAIYRSYYDEGASSLVARQYAGLL